MTDHWMQTHTGKAIDLVEPDIDDIDLEDIAHALANQCRFNGHTKHFYSTAQHSVIVSCHCSGARAPRQPQPWSLVGLLHDAAEAYIGDFVRPLKPLLKSIKKIEKGLQAVIARKWDFDPLLFESDIIRHNDARALATERRDLLRPDCPREWADLPPPFEMLITPLPPHDAKQLFLYQFHRITRNNP